MWIFVALHTLEEFDEDIADWDEIDQSELTHADRLTIVSEELVKLKRMATKLGSADVQELLRTAQFAMAVDHKLVDWFEACPSDWTAVPAANVTDTNLKAWGAWGSRVDVLPDIFVSSLLNQARAYRISVQTIIAQCLTHPSSPFQRISMSTHPAHVVQMLVDDICATIPFAVGDRYHDGQQEDEITYPHAAGIPTSVEHRGSAYKSGGWFLVRCHTLCVTDRTS